MMVAQRQSHFNFVFVFVFVFGFGLALSAAEPFKRWKKVDLQIINCLERQAETIIHII